LLIGYPLNLPDFFSASYDNTQLVRNRYITGISRKIEKTRSNAGVTRNPKEPSIIFSNSDLAPISSTRKTSTLFFNLFKDRLKLLCPVRVKE